VRASGSPAVAALTAALLVGCPLPQPLPDYPAGQPVTPPRIVVDDSFGLVTLPETVVRVPAACSTRPTYVLDAQLRDSTGLPVVARWFVNYDPTTQPGSMWEMESTITEFVANDPTLRDIPEFGFPPYDYDSLPSGPGSAVGALHVVDLVVSNGFHGGGPEEPVPNRSPAAEREVQLYRWVFLNVAASAPGCTDPGCVPCPEPPAP
jgi:hypothetical protein